MKNQLLSHIETQASTAINRTQQSTQYKNKVEILLSTKIIFQGAGDITIYENKGKTYLFHSDSGKILELVNFNKLQTFINNYLIFQQNDGRYSLVDTDKDMIEDSDYYLIIYVYSEQIAYLHGIQMTNKKYPYILLQKEIDSEVKTVNYIQNT